MFFARGGGGGLFVVFFLVLGTLFGSWFNHVGGSLERGTPTLILTMAQSQKLVGFC